MKKSLSLFLGASLLVSALPMALAESSNTIDVRSTFSTRCKDLTGEEKIACSKEAAKDKMEARFRKNPKAEARKEACKELSGLAKGKCLRARLEPTQQQKIDQRMDMRIMKTKNKMMMRMKVNMRGNSSSSSSSAQ